MNDESWLNVFQWVAAVAIVISLIGAVFINIFSSRVNRAMKIEIAQSNEMSAKSNAVAAMANERAEEIKADNLRLGLQLEKERHARLEIER